MELRDGRQVHLPGRTRHVQRLRVLLGRQQPAGDGDRRGTCSSRASSSTCPTRVAPASSWSWLLSRQPSSTSRYRPVSPTHGCSRPSPRPTRTVRSAWCRASRRASDCRPRYASRPRPRPPGAGSPAPAGSATSAAPFSTSAPASRRSATRPKGRVRCCRGAVAHRPPLSDRFAELPHGRWGRPVAFVIARVVGGLAAEGSVPGDDVFDSRRR